MEDFEIWRNCQNEGSGKFAKMIYENYAEMGPLAAGAAAIAEEVGRGAVPAGLLEGRARCELRTRAAVLGEAVLRPRQVPPKNYSKDQTH